MTMTRNVHGILLFNKPLGISSNAALQKVKRLFQAKKAGHTGSLDNLATGLLPICLGEATKLSGFLLSADKWYQAECVLGVMTTTADAEGEVIRTGSIAGIDRQQIESAIRLYMGPIQQIPPMYSALKHQGQPLYRLARRGEVISREARAVTIYALTLIDFTDNRLTLEIHCSKGTYIRTLAEDIGNTLGCGAYVSALHRTAAGPYHEMIDLPTLEQTAQQGLAALDALLMPLDTALVGWPTLTLASPDVVRLRQGQTIRVSHALEAGRVKLYGHTKPQSLEGENHDESTEFIGIGQILDDGRVAPQRLICF